MSIEDLNLSRNQKVFIIKTVSERLQAKLLILNDSMSSLYYENFSLEARDLMADFCKFSNSVEQLQSNNEYSKIDDETLNYLTILSLVVSEEYRLKVRTPQGQKQYDFMVDKFKHDVYTVSLQRLNTNIAGFAVFKEALINEYNSKQYNYLAPVYEIIDLQNEIDEIDKKLDLCQWNSDDKGYSELSERKHEIKNRIKTIRNENPLACHFSNQFDVKQTIVSLCYRVSKAMNNTRKSLVDKKYPIWELTPIITYLFENIEYYQDPKIQYEILEWLQEQRKLENGKKFAANALSISLSLLCICFSGGSSLFINMIRLAAITDGILVAADDYQDAKMHSDMAHGQKFISDDAKKVIESSNLSAIDINYIFAAVSFGLALIDLKDCYKIIKKMNILDELSKAYLRIFKKPGVKLLNTFTAEEINKLAKLCSKYDKKLFAAICDLPEDEIRKLLNASDYEIMLKYLNDIPIEKIQSGILNDISNRVFLYVPKNNGDWTGVIGNSRWIPDDNYVPLNPKTNPDGLSWKKIKEKYGIKEINFISGEPDFTSISKGNVKINDFSADRDLNFIKADEELAKLKNCDPDDVFKWRKKNRYTWHECKDCLTLQKVPTEVHGNITHAGGISETKKIQF